jgi:hypothetical protein
MAKKCWVSSVVAALGLVAALVSGCHHPSPPRPIPPRPPKYEDTKPEDVVVFWIDAFTHCNVGALLSVSATPFYFQNGTITSADLLRQRYETLKAEKCDRVQRQPVEIRSTKVETVAERRAKLGPRFDPDGRLRLLSLADSDWFIEVQTQHDSLGFIVKTVDGHLRLVGLL